MVCDLFVVFVHFEIFRILCKLSTIERIEDQLN